MAELVFATEMKGNLAPVAGKEGISPSEPREEGPTGSKRPLSPTWRCWSRGSRRLER